jgi:hypothetical protein
MGSNSHFFLDLGAFSAFAMSNLMDASSFLVGTFFNSFFRPSSTGGSL